MMSLTSGHMRNAAANPIPAPVRSFCMQAAGRIREADYLLVHHTCGRYETAAREMDALLGLTHTGFRTLQCHTGHYRTR